ncbi:MAG: CHAT domain-containing protein, partial [Cyanobacteria bacterium J06632_22]
EAPNGTSGNVTLTAAGDITTGDIVAEGLVSGDIDLFSLEGEIDTGDIFGYSDGFEPSSDTARPTLNTLNFSRATLSANAADAAVVELETERTQAFSDYFDTDLQAQTLSPAEIQTVLGNVAQATGTRSAIVYVNAPSVTGDTGLEIILFTADNNPIRLKTDSVTQPELAQTVDRFRRTLVSSVRQGSSTYLPPAQQLYDWLIAPIEAELGEGKIDNLLFSMDAGLRAVPLAALHDGEQFLIEKYSLGTVPAIGLMRTDYKSLENAQMLAMGVSEFEQMSPLPAVPAEIKTITELWDGAGFLNEEFTRQNLISQRQQTPYEILHLATHAEFKAGTAEESFIQLWDDRLRLSEVDDLGWKNPAVELLVLSACQTAVGSLEAEMGFAGLSIASGVRTSVASLWSVDDAGTLALMTNFYGQLQSAEVKSEALRQAQLAMLRGDMQIEQGQLRNMSTASQIPLPSALEGVSNLSHPFYWAGFAMVGNPW